MSGKPFRIKRVYINIATFVIAVLVFLALAEITLRIISERKVEIAGRFKYKPRPDGSLLPTKVNAFRKVPDDRSKAPGEMRIIALGDSYTWGEKISDYRDLWTTVLEDRLKEDYPEKKIEVINLAIKGFTTMNELELLSGYGMKFSPDIVVVQFDINDPLMSGRNFTHDDETWLHDRNPRFIPNKLLHTFFSKSRLFRMLDDYYVAFRFRITGDTYYDPLYRDYFDGWIDCQKALYRMSYICRKNGAKPVLVIFPRLYNGEMTKLGYVYKSIHEKVARVARKTGFYVLDLYPVYAEKDPHMKGLMTLEGHDPHPNEKAQKIAAIAIEKFLTDHHFIR